MSEKLQQMQELLDKLSEEINNDNSEYNELVGSIALLQETNRILTIELEKATGDLANVIHQNKNFTSITAELKRLKALNPAKLSKANKLMKKRNDELKARLVDSEKGRKEALTLYTKAKKIAQQKGKEPFYTDNKLGTSISASGFVVGKDNKLGMLEGAPMLVYTHETKGISRHGMMNKEGGIIWASAKNTSPTEDESQVARAFIEEYCKRLNIKLPKESK